MNRDYIQIKENFFIFIEIFKKYIVRIRDIKIIFGR